MQGQLTMFETAKEEVKTPEKPFAVRVGSHIANVNLARKRREALGKFCALLDELEGKDIWLGTYGGSGSHFWMNHLKLERLQVETMGNPPAVIVFRGRKEASVRIFTDQVVNLREQDYQAYTLWLLDFWNGFGEHPLDPYRPKGYVSLDIVRFKD